MNTHSFPNTILITHFHGQDCIDTVPAVGSGASPSHVIVH